MEWKICTPEDIPQLSELNGQLHEDEGAVPMETADREARLSRWIGSDYTAVLFSIQSQTLGYTLFRSTDPDSEGLDQGVFIRQFFVIRDQRQQGIGRQMFHILREHVWKNGCGILLDTEYENSRAQAFWRSLGFSEHHVSFIRRPSG